MAHATTPELGTFTLDLEAEDRELDTLLATVGQQSKAGLWGIKRRLKEALKKTRTLLAALRSQRKALLRELVQRLKATRKTVREEKTALRLRFKQEFAALVAQEKAALIGYDQSRERVLQDHGAALSILSKRKRQLENARNKISELDGSAQRRQKAYIAQKEREGESDDQVRYHLEKNFPEAIPWFDQNKNKFKKAKARTSRLETILEYLEENPEKVQEARVKDAELAIKAQEKREKELGKRYERLERQRSTRRGAAVRRAGQRSAAVTFGKRLDKTRKAQAAGLEEAPF